MSFCALISVDSLQRVSLHDVMVAECFKYVLQAFVKETEPP